MYFLKERKTFTSYMHSQKRKSFMHTSYMHSKKKVSHIHRICILKKRKGELIGEENLDYTHYLASDPCLRI